MSEWFDSQNNKTNDFQKLLKERIEKSYPRRELTTEEAKCLNKLGAIVKKLKRGENVQTLLSMFRWNAILLISINISLVVYL